MSVRGKIEQKNIRNKAKEYAGQYRGIFNRLTAPHPYNVAVNAWIEGYKACLKNKEE